MLTSDAQDFIRFIVQLKYNVPEYSEEKEEQGWFSKRDDTWLKAL